MDRHADAHENVQKRQKINFEWLESSGDWLRCARNHAFYAENGKWEVENVGVSPDYEVEFDPKQVQQGHDPQLEKAVEVVLDLLQKNPLPQYKKPPYPNYQQPTSSKQQ